MNKLNTSVDNGMSLELEDIEFFYNALKEGISGVAKGAGDMWLVGVVFSTNPDPTPWEYGVFHTEGFLFCNGEVFKVEAIDVANSINYGDDSRVIFCLDETNDPSGAELNYVGAPVNTYLLRKAKLEHLPDGDPVPSTYLCDWPTLVEPNGVQNYDALLKAKIAPIPTWTNGGDYLNGFISDPAYPFQYCKDPLGFVHLRGNVKNVTGVASGFICGSGLFSANCRINKEVNKIVACTHATEDTQANWVKKTADHKLWFSKIYGDSPSTNEIICLDGISFHVG